MTTTCPEPAAASAPVADPQLREEMDAAARCAALLEDAGLRVAFDERADSRAPSIVLERLDGTQLRPLRPSELLELLAATPAHVRAWAQAPELPFAPGEAR